MTKCDPEQLVETIGTFKGVPVLVVGDLMLDQYIWGKVDRVSPEAPVVVVSVTREDKRPGGAAGTVNNLVSLGAAVSVCGVVGDDESGRELVRMLRQSGVDVSGVMIDRSRPTTVKTRILAQKQNQQVVRVDRETEGALDAGMATAVAAQVEARIPAVKGVALSDYAKGVINSALFEAIDRHHAAGRLGLGKIPLVIDPKGPNFSLYRGATVVKPNRSEAESASGVPIRGRSDALKAGEALLRRWNSEMILVTLGEDGMVLVSDAAKAERSFEVDTVARQVYDVSGAGDTVCAVLTLAMAAGASPEIAARLANFAAGVVVGEVGTVPVRYEQLVDAIRRGGE